MKKLLFAVLCIAASCQAQVPNDQCQVSIKIDNLDNTLVAYLLDERLAQPERVDTIHATDGQFTYNAQLDGMRVCVFLTLDRKTNVQAYLVPGHKLEITGDSSTYHLGGSPLYDELDKAASAGDEYKQQMTALQEEYTQRMQAGEDPEALRNDIVTRYNDIAVKMREAECKYIAENAGTQGAVLLLSGLTNGEFAKYDAIVTDEAKKGALAPMYNNARAAYERELQRQKAAEALAPGKPAPDFTLEALEGGTLSLSSLRGKYVIIDFWGAWCGWCIKGMPDMKKYYEKYGDRLEILGIDCRDTDDKWRAAVEKHQLTWKHVKNGNGADDITVRYAITGFPTKVLVDPQGNIVKVIVGEDPQFYDLLDEVLGK